MLAWRGPFREEPMEKLVPTLKAPVVVALLEVEFRAVKLSKVEEPESSKLLSEVCPAVAVKVPVKLAALEIVCELMRAEVMAPVFRVVEKRLVEEATVE